MTLLNRSERSLPARPMSIVLGLLTLCGACLADRPAFADPPDLTFFGWSDQHVQTDGNAEHLLPAIDAMNSLPGTKYPAAMGGEVAAPAFVFGCGDITEWPSRAAIDRYAELVTKRLKFPSYDVIGNHDEGGKSPTDTVKSWLRRRHGELTYTFEQHGVRFIALYSPYDESLNNPAQPLQKEALNELAKLLSAAPRDQPTIMATHLCYDAMTNKDELIDVLAPYRILMILSGHYHKTHVDLYRGQTFVQLPSPAPNGQREIAVFRITPDRMSMRAYSFAKNAWVDDPGKMVDAPLPAAKTDTAVSDSPVAKRIVRADDASPNRLQPERWQPWKSGFESQENTFVCDNGDDASAQRGASQTVVLNQTRPEPIVAVVSSRAENVGGSPDNDYALYLDLAYADGTSLWGQTAPFDVGTHDWQSRRVVVVPEKPIQTVSMHLLLRSHSGKAWFRQPSLQVLATPAGAARFDGVPVIPAAEPVAGFQVRDVAADSDYVRIAPTALQLQLQCEQTKQANADFFDVTLTDTSGKDRAVTLVYSIPVPAQGTQWLSDPRHAEPVVPGREYVNATQFSGVGSNGRMSWYPLGAVASGDQGTALGIDMQVPAFYRIGYHADLGELYLAYDLGLTPEKPTARVRFCRFGFEARHAFRGALARYYEIFPQDFQCRTPEQGLWMPFAKISEVRGWEDFGFKFKEGDNETAWDDQHGMLTFRYTEPLTWWMSMPDSVPRTIDAATEYAKTLAKEKDDRHAQSLLNSGYQDREGRFVARLLDTPWCRGAVWSMNSMPGIQATPSDFSLKWNADLRNELYGPNRKADLDGEYIDSSEGYVTDLLDFRRDHFAGADTPLVFCSVTHQPALFRGLITFEYVRQIARDVHALNRLMMANATPIQLCWLAPQLEVLGTETDWNPAGQWRPMSDRELLFRRALCKGKPYCFLMNSQFENFSHELVERYMKRALAYGMFPGFFSHNASEGHYFTRPELYDRDRDLFRLYVPLCRRVAEAGWEPLTGATTDLEQVYVERFGNRLLTVYNDSNETRAVKIRCELDNVQGGRDLLRQRDVTWRDGVFELTLPAEDVAVIEIQ